MTDEDGNPVEDATLHLLAKAHEAALFAQVRDPATFAFENQRVRWEERTNSSGFFRVCWLPADLPIELMILAEDENVDRGALRAALSLADLHPGRVTALTIDPESPHRRLDLRVEG